MPVTPKLVPLTTQEAHQILEALDGVKPLDAEVRSKLEDMRTLHMRDLDVLANYKRGQKNQDLYERWDTKQGAIIAVARRLGL